MISWWSNCWFTSTTTKKWHLYNVPLECDVMRSICIDKTFALNLTKTDTRKWQAVNPNYVCTKKKSTIFFLVCVSMLIKIDIVQSECRFPVVVHISKINNFRFENVTRIATYTQTIFMHWRKKPEEFFVATKCKKKNHFVMHVVQLCRKASVYLKLMIRSSLVNW